MHRRKILLAGPPGTGKTMTAKVLANELQIPLYTIQMDRLVTKFMGETSAKLRQIFDLIQKEPGVYLFDEFDAIGSERSLENDVGEMRRVLNSFLQFIEQDNSDSLIVAATNNPKLLDHALFRRFDDVLYYERPDFEERKQLIQNIMGTFITSRFEWKTVLEESEGLSHAEIDHACRDSIKQAILSDQVNVNAKLLLQMLKERQGTHPNFQR
jgi:SpoVK/Ycf46/Vps4 family AAA+-type ATPase